MRNRLAAGALLAATLPVLAACGSSSDNGDTITFAAVPAEASTSLKGDYENITKLIEKETGKKVKFQDASDYAAVIEGQRAGKIDVASYGPFSYAIAKDSGVNLEPVASPSDKEAESPTYTSLAYVKGKSSIKSLKDLKGKKVCFVDAASTSGYLVPSKGLMDEGLDMKKDIEPVMAGGHDASLLSLNSGNCDVAFAHDAMLSTLDKPGQLKAKDFHSIWESDPITEDPIALNADTLDAEVVDKIRTAIRDKANKPALVKDGICSSEEDCNLPEETGWGYKKVEDKDFDSIRELCRVTKADACTNVG